MDSLCDNVAWRVAMIFLASAILICAGVLSFLTLGSAGASSGSSPAPASSPSSCQPSSCQPSSCQSSQPSF
eukprot:7148601-Pyramimonas_sp.AAC.1